MDHWGGEIKRNNSASTAHSELDVAQALELFPMKTPAAALDIYVCIRLFTMYTPFLDRSVLRHDILVDS